MCQNMAVVPDILRPVYKSEILIGDESVVSSNKLLSSAQVIIPLLETAEFFCRC